MCPLPVLRHRLYLLLFLLRVFHIFHIFPSIRVFLLFPRTRVFTRRGREEARSFDSTAFLPIRQTFDSLTWEPRNSSVVATFILLQAPTFGQAFECVRYVCTWFLASILHSRYFIESLHLILSPVLPTSNLVVREERSIFTAAANSRNSPRATRFSRARIIATQATRTRTC